MWRRLLVVVMLVATILPMMPTPDAEAFAGRGKWHGYFFDGLDTAGGACGGGDVLCGGMFPGAANPTGDFIGRLWNELTVGGAQNSTGAAFIVLTMMGYPPGTPKAQAGAIFWTDFVPAVQYYNSQGWVAWNSWASGAVQNTYWQGSPGPDDVAWYDDVVGSEAILFYNPNTGGSYWIRKACANPLGTLAALVMPPAPDFDMTLSASALTSENGSSPYTVVAGQPYSLGATIHNNGPADSTAGNLQVMLPPAGVCTPGGGCPLNQTNTPSGGAVTGQGFRPASAIGGTIGPGPNWYWTTGAFSPGGNLATTMQFTPTGAVGTTFNMEVYYAPGDLGGAVRHVTLSYRIVSKRTPGISGANSDIHAGGGTCGAAPGPNGSVTTSPSGASVGQYVVSASGTINSIFSNNASTTVNDRLRVGGTGGYSQVCRADLLAAVNAEYPLAGSNCFPASCAAVNQTVTLTGNEEGVYYFNGAHLNLRGSVGNAATTKPLTIVARFGEVEINGNITLTNVVRFPHEAPSLGIISANDILIDPAATQVDAYLFSSNGSIVTCNAAVAACASVLRVNGFLMAKDMLFGRTGLINTNGTAPSEIVVLNPQIYLNPPRYFDAGVDDILLEGQGERAPLF